MAPRSARQRLTDWVFARVFAPAGALLLRLVCASWRLRVSGLEHVAPFWSAGRPVIVCCWHGRLLMLPYTWLRHGGGEVYVLMGKNRNGELITRIVSRFNMKAVRGSSRAGGKEARDEMAALVAQQSATTIALTPDGPHGPALVSKLGAAQLSRQSDLPVVWASASAAPALRAPTWDDFVMPLPFARVKVRFSAPVFPAQYASLTLEAYRDALDEVGREALAALDATL
ncbi:MAG: DUF374 domain-containing protein [Myxococcus sp.]|nr:DUF374 domain-containing protein [Myxococcus sp.]